MGSLVNLWSVNLKSMKRYPRKMYHSRGRVPGKDVIAQVLARQRNCIICGKTIERKVSKSGRTEDFCRFTKRKTCGFFFDSDGKMYQTECLRKSREAEGNSNYKGIMPHCIDCGKRIFTYPAKKAKGLRCRPCDNLSRVGVPKAKKKAQ